MKIIEVTWKIVGRNLRQSNPAVMWEESVKEEQLKVTHKKRGLVGTDSETFQKARKALYVNEDGLCYHPAIAFWKGLLAACARRVLGDIPALEVLTMGVALVQEEFILCDPDTLDAAEPKPYTPEDKWQIDKRRGVNHNKQVGQGGVGIVIILPIWKRWGGFLTMEVDLDLFKGEDFSGLTDLLNIVGHNFGIGAGHIRLTAIRYRKEIWGGLGTGKFTATLKQ